MEEISEKGDEDDLPKFENVGNQEFIHKRIKNGLSENVWDDSAKKLKNRGKVLRNLKGSGSKRECFGLDKLRERLNKPR
jgi:hypothetical protein